MTAPSSSRVSACLDFEVFWELDVDIGTRPPALRLLYESRQWWTEYVRSVHACTITYKDIHIHTLNTKINRTVGRSRYMSLCLYVHCAYIHAYMHAQIQIHTYILTYLHLYIHKHTYINIHRIHMHTYAYIHIHAHKYTYMYICLHVHIHTTDRHNCIHDHTCIYTSNAYAWLHTGGR